MRRDNRGISRIVEFVIMFTVFLVIVTSFYSLVNIWTRPPIVNYNQEEAMRVSEVMIGNPGYLKNESADWEECNATVLNSNLTSLGFAVDNNSYGVLSMKKIIAMRNLTYKKAKQVMALDYLNFNITFRYFNGSIMLSNKTDNKTTLTFGVNFGDNATVSWKRIVNIVNLTGKYENATLTVYLSKHGRFDESVVINEIMYDPPEAGDNFNEFVELYNSANMAVNLSGWIIEDLLETDYTDYLLEYNNMGRILSAHNYALIVDNETSVISVSENFTVSPNVLWLTTPKDEIEYAIGGGLDNPGDTITLRNKYYDCVDKVSYESSWGIDKDVDNDDANGKNESLEKKNSLGPNTEENWSESRVYPTTVGGTPGRKNSIS